MVGVKRRREETGVKGRASSILEKEQIHEPDEVLYHLGRSTTTSYWTQCWSSVKVLDSMCKAVNWRGLKLSYTLMSVYKKNGTKVSKVGKVWVPVSLKYKKVKNELEQLGLTVEDYKTLKKKVLVVEKVLDEFILILKKLSGDKSWGVNKILRYCGVLETYLGNVTQNDIGNVSNIRKLLQRDAFEGYLSGMLNGEKIKIIPATTDEDGRKGRKKEKRKPRLPKKKDANNPHSKEDSNIPKRPKTSRKTKPGAREESNEEKGTTANEGSIDSSLKPQKSQWDPIFSGETKQYHLEGNQHPVIILEHFVNASTNELASGPIKSKSTGENYEIGGEYLNNCKEDHKVKLGKVLAAETCDQYAYGFQHADRVPHFVVSYEKYKEYMIKVMESKSNPSLTVISKEEYEKAGPIKVLGTDTIRKGIRGGKDQDGQFFFFPNSCDEFQQFLNPDSLRFPTDNVMDYFDQYVINENDISNRGFSHLVEGGLGREGVCRSTWDTQEEGQDKVVAKPAMTGANITFKGTNMIETIGGLADAMMNLVDEYVRDENGEKLMNDTARDNEFGSDFREIAGMQDCRFEAFTLIRQFLGTVDDFQEGKLFTGTGRHLDGPNDRRDGYNWTFVLSFLVVRDGKVYRLTLILYTRTSCGNWMQRNYIARHLRRKLRDHAVEYNGNIEYRSLFLQDDLSQYKVEAGDSEDSISFWFVPKENDLTRTFFERMPKSRWKEERESPQKKRRDLRESHRRQKRKGQDKHKSKGKRQRNNRRGGDARCGECSGPGSEGQRHPDPVQGTSPGGGRTQTEKETPVPVRAPPGGNPVCL